MRNHLGTWNLWTWTPGWPGAFLVFLGVTAAALWIPADVQADKDDYSVDSGAWNGLKDLVTIARAAGLSLETPSSLDLSLLNARDGLLLLYPTEPPPRPDLAAFMADGGRLGVADDFGAGKALLEGFRIGRSAPSSGVRALRLRDNQALRIAKPQFEHALSADVVALVTNHPQVLHHDALDAVFALGDRADAIVLTGAVGNGRLVALADPSTLINNMLEFRGNRVFAGNLVRYLAHGGRLWIATPATTFTGHYAGLAVTDPLASLRTLLQRVATVSLPPAAIRATTAVIVALLLFASASALPRRSTYARAMALPTTDTNAGFAGQVRFFLRPRRSYLAPALAYRQEFEYRSAALHANSDDAQRNLSGTTGARSATTAPRDLLEQARAFRAELDALAVAAGRPPDLPRVTKRKFHDVVAVGDRILAALESQNR